jgi:hypothetical protein
MVDIFCIIYENRRMKLLYEGGKRENDEGVNLTKIYCKPRCRYHYVFPCTTLIR